MDSVKRVAGYTGAKGLGLGHRTDFWSCQLGDSHDYLVSMNKGWQVMCVRQVTGPSGTSRCTFPQSGTSLRQRGSCERRGHSRGSWDHKAYSACLTLCILGAGLRVCVLLPSDYSKTFVSNMPPTVGFFILLQCQHTDLEGGSVSECSQA